MASVTHPGFASPQAMQRFRHIAPHLEADVPLARLADHAGISVRTLQRWLARYRAEGIKGLERSVRSDYGQRKIAPDLAAMIRRQMSRKPRPTIAAIHRRLCAIAHERDLTVPSYAVVARIARHMAPARIALTTDAAGYRDRHELVHRYEAAAPNALWQADHTVLDIRILDDQGTPVRPWLTTVLDDYSRAIAGYFLALDAPSAMNTALALYQAIGPKADPAWPICGIPEQLYVDNGTDFVSEHIEQACIALKIRLVHSRPGRPRGRGKVERLFRTVNDMFLPDLPGHLIKGRPLSQPSLTLPELIERFEVFLHAVYHPRPHGTTGEAPLRRWQAGGFLPNLPASRQALDMLLLQVPKPRKVRCDGIRFMSRRYVEPTLAAFIGEQVTVLYDPRDPAEIRVYHAGDFICRALCPEHPDASDSAAIRRARRGVKQDLQRAIDSDATSHDAAPSTESRANRRGCLKLYADDD